MPAYAAAAMAERHAGDNLESHARARQGLCFLPSPAKDVGIAALEPDDNFALRGAIQQQSVDFVLSQRMGRCRFSRIDNFRSGAHPVQHLRIAEIIVNQNVRLPDELFRAQRDQVQRARPRPYQIDAPVDRFRAHRESSTAKSTPSASGLSMGRMRLPRRGSVSPISQAMPSSRRWFPSTTSA